MIAVLAGLAVSVTTAAGAMAQTYVGGQVCADCHPEQAKQWSGSHHDLAMQPASESTVLGDFSNARLSHFGVASTFYRKDDRFFVRTEGPDGKLEDYAVKYTFGVDPLQQYLVEFPGGRLQALNLAWDTRPKSDGGQRWFHLYPDEKIAPDDQLHWTRPAHNWNSMCAECHSTHLQKNYDPANKTFATTWSEIDVACEACHGPGSSHVQWAERKPKWKQYSANKGLVLSLDERKDVRWKINEKTGNAARSKARNSDREIEMCARCHARRSPISDDYVPGEPLLDHYLPSLLEEDLYYADGQIKDEVYVYGSFVQSKMYHAGVTCSDCHEPHSLKLRAAGNGVCLQCHRAEKYDQAGHHFHQPGSKGARCVECHMPPKTYMVVDSRHDHSMHIPRPDLSVRLGTPNACSTCHTDKSVQWAADQVKAWYGRTPAGFQQYAQTLYDARHEEPRAGEELVALIRNPEIPAIARATALVGFGPYLRPATLDALAVGLSDPDPSVRRATVAALDYVPVDMRVQQAFPMLDDPVRAVRIEAARILAATPAGDLSKDQQRLLDRVTSEYIEAQQAMAERPEAQTNLGNLYAAQGKIEKAVAAYRTAMALDPQFIPASINLADLYRARGDEQAAEKILRAALGMAGDHADVHHALGLLLVRRKQMDEAVAELRRAAELSPDNVRYVYVYAIALQSTGEAEEAVMVLQGAHTAHPGNADVLRALVAFHRELGNQAAARSYADKLRALSP